MTVKDSYQTQPCDECGEPTKVCNGRSFSVVLCLSCEEKRVKDKFGRNTFRPKIGL